MNGYETFEKALASGYRVGIYCRLSKDDDIADGDSVSIQHQRQMLEDYCKQKGWEIVKVYQDDGFSGLNQNRPDLQRLLKDVKSKKINLVITKDYSRLGRNHLETGSLLEDFFPRNGCRYIAINDNIDTLFDDNDIAPFKGIINEMYSRDISKKVHSAYSLQAKNGIYTGTVAPFGYKKDPDKKGHLIIDEETAPFVRMIFDLARKGKGAQYICTKLERARVPSPAYWLRKRGLRNQITKWEVKDPENGMYVWDVSIMKDILMNPVYYGAISSQKCNYKFKIGSIGSKKPEDWIVVENMHEGIIDKSTFQIVQQKIKSRKRVNASGNLSLFAGMIKCGDCGRALTVKKSNGSDKYLYTCSTYNKHGKRHCSQHRVDLDILEKHVLKEIKRLANEALGNDVDAAKSIDEKLRVEQRRQNMDCQKNIARAKERLSVLEKMLTKVYEDHICGRINENTFNTIVDNNQREQEEVKKTLEELENTYIDGTESSGNAEKWLQLISEFKEIETLDVETLNKLINKIVVYETKSYEEKSREITLEIHFNFKPYDDTTTHTIEGYSKGGYAINP